MSRVGLKFTALPRNLGKHTPLFQVTEKAMNPLLKVLPLSINKANFIETGEYKSINVERTDPPRVYLTNKIITSVMSQAKIHCIWYPTFQSPMSSRQLFPWTFLTFLTYHIQSILIALNIPEMQCESGHVHSLGKMLTTTRTILTASPHATAAFSHDDNSVPWHWHQKVALNCCLHLINPEVSHPAEPWVLEERAWLRSRSDLTSRYVVPHSFK